MIHKFIEENKHNKSNRIICEHKQYRSICLKAPEINELCLELKAIQKELNGILKIISFGGVEAMNIKALKRL